MPESGRSATALTRKWRREDMSEVHAGGWTTTRGVEAMDNSYRLLVLTVYGRQEMWEDSPAG
jgi:predicted dithiol-disulfide oxidoreductase (DUF899 family)